LAGRGRSAAASDVVYGRPGGGLLGSLAVARARCSLLVANILDGAVEYELLPSNPARGKRRRLKAARPSRRFLEADELGEVLAAAAELDRAARSDRRIGRRPMIAVMAKSGLRVSEVCQLRWRSVDLHHKRLVVEQSKTDAGVRDVDLSLDLLDELLAWRAESSPAGVDAFVFPTASGRPRDKDSVRERVLAPVIARVNGTRADRCLPPLPKVTPHALRRTYISPMLEAGAPLPYVMDQVAIRTRRRRSRSTPRSRSGSAARRCISRSMSCSRAPQTHDPLRNPMRRIREVGPSQGQAGERTGGPSAWPSLIMRLS
jgi:integrase